MKEINAYPSQTRRESGGFGVKQRYSRDRWVVVLHEIPVIDSMVRHFEDEITGQIFEAVAGFCTDIILDINGGRNVGDAE